MRFVSAAVLSLIPCLAQTVEPLDQWSLHSVVQIQADLHHVQGIDVEGDRLWISSVNAKAGKGYLSLVSLPSGRVVAQVEVQEGKRIHPGGITLDGASIWIPVAEYDRDGPSSIQRRDKNSLTLESSFEVSDHIGSIAAGPTGLIGGNWDSRLIYAWSRDGREQWRKESPYKTAWQDLKMDGDRLVGSGNVSRDVGAIETVSLPDLRLIHLIKTGKTDRGVTYTHEGMTLRGGRLYLLPEDAPTRLFEFRRR